ncbi:hypothetical protein SCATT_27170 [Streptantibioticus cattleyicolor NRRL 8057 = DSM 46488]|uniref:Uncharacterized protein n=1 Tax=Streptantibioticus cattleyicolor (strain ATCC 35852 / DSM 46488 / JCM 4925 / NBRC 14057 / NRRL 8057) TaxID=1003195 RepID=G8X2H1_STREN|nr:hypothetical protein SCATT_27170 [Streptantibioticus cattleyicolor NRRL 8057 = DSM 46488]
MRRGRRSRCQHQPEHSHHASRQRGHAAPQTRRDPTWAQVFFHVQGAFPARCLRRRRSPPPIS